MPERSSAPSLFGSPANFVFLITAARFQPESRLQAAKVELDFNLGFAAFLASTLAWARRSPPTAPYAAHSRACQESCTNKFTEPATSQLRIIIQGEQQSKAELAILALDQRHGDVGKEASLVRMGSVGDACFEQSDLSPATAKAHSSV
ncbi:hypothetical protein L1887_50652 [Cichorium endivia]|nr:hypothetical protein L1887_50652 [Cichorium endivia]